MAWIVDKFAVNFEIIEISVAVLLIFTASILARIIDISETNILNSSPIMGLVGIGEN